MMLEETQPVPLAIINVPPAQTKPAVRPALILIEC
jgi:hypothetical protein